MFYVYILFFAIKYNGTKVHDLPRNTIIIGGFYSQHTFK